MEYWTGKNTKIPKLGFGTWMLKGSEATSSIEMALSAGYRHIDTASIYDNEEAIGVGLKNSSVPRDEIFLTTKIWRDYLSPENIEKEIETSLKKLKTDCVDLLLIHWPNDKFSLEESLRTFEALVKQGKTRFIGVSNFPSGMLVEALKICPSILANQVEYHPFLSQQKVLEVINAQKDMCLTAYSSLARGEILKSQQIEHIAKKYNKTISQIVLRWLVEQKNVIALAKSGNEKRMKENLKIFDFQLEKSDQDKLFRLSNQKRRLVDPPFAPDWD